MISIDDVGADGFQFEIDAGRQFASFTQKDHAEQLEKWGIPPCAMVGQHYRTSAVFRRGMADEFFCALFNDDAFRANFKLSDGRGRLTACAIPGKVTSVKYTALTCHSTSLDMFDRLVNDEIVREGGSIARCADVYLPGGVTVANHLRTLFMVGEDDNDFFDVFDEGDKREFLYHIMWRLVTGGSLCQWDDEFEPYRDLTRSVYKDMVVVGRNADEDLEVQSLVYQIHSATLADGSDVPLFPRADDNGNWLYVSVHPQRRTVSVWYNAFWSQF